MSKIKFYKCLRIAQAQKGITNVGIAKHFKVHQQQVMRWRKSDSVKLDLIQDLAEFFGMTTLDFLGLDHGQED